MVQVFRALGCGTHSLGDGDEVEPGPCRVACGDGYSNAHARAPEIMLELIELAESGRLRPVVGGTYPLAEAASAHAAIEARTPVGKVVLVP